MRKIAAAPLYSLDEIRKLEPNDLHIDAHSGMVLTIVQSLAAQVQDMDKKLHFLFQKVLEDQIRG